MSTLRLNAHTAFDHRVLMVGNTAYGAWCRGLLATDGTNTIGLAVALQIAKRSIWKQLEAVGLAEIHGDIVTLKIERNDDAPLAKWERSAWSRRHYDVVRRRDGNKCRYCGSTDRLTVDHVIPRVMGGSDCATNLVVACRSCNSSKGGRTPDQAGMRLLGVPS